MEQQIKPFQMDWKPMKRSAPDWFRDAKFGLFFHWGPYCVPACENEWYSRNMYAKGLSQNEHHEEKYGKLSEFGYKDFYKDFTGEKFDADAWAELVIRSGAKYAGPVTEHADNFSMWDSKVNSTNSVNYGPRKDVVGEFEKAIRARGLNFIATFHHQWLWGWFMSTDADADVYHPANEKYYGKPLPLETKRYIPWQLPDDEFNEVWMQKVIEVIDAYNPDLVYFDSRANIIAESFKHRLLEYYYNRPGARSNTVVSYKQTDFPDDVGLLDIECGRFSDVQNFEWQTDDRLEAKRTWCHVEEPEYKSAGEIIRQLCDVVSKNGNLLLNVGPRTDGTFPEEAKSVLYEVGDWLSLYGEAIYGTRPYTVFGEGATEVKDTNFDINQIEEQTRIGVIEEDSKYGLLAEDIRFTTKGNILYVITMGRSDKEQMEITSLADGAGLASKRISRIDMVGGAEDLKWSRSVTTLTIELKGEMPSLHANVLRIVYEEA
jgi:alpha-L-fucosidase